MSINYRPSGFDGSFLVSGLSLRLSRDQTTDPSGAGVELHPLPEAEQPDSDQPMASDPRPNDGDPSLPRVQLFDITTNAWVEFEPVRASTTYRIGEPLRFVDGSGAVRVRFVLRDQSSFAQFGLGVKLEGTVQ
jgi:hypothetical protein